MEKKQIVVVTGCILDGTRVLLTQRYEPELPEADRKWDLPGGKAEFGEDSRKAAQREVREETGLDVIPGELVPYVHTNFWRYQDKWLHVVLLCYVCSLHSGSTKIRRSAREVRSAKWIEIGEIDLHKTLPGIREFLGWVAKHKVGVTLPVKKVVRYVHLHCLSTEKNMDKFYIVSDGLPSVRGQMGQMQLFANDDEFPKAFGPFVVSRFWGRRNSIGRHRLEEYYSEHAAIRRMHDVVKHRQARGYALIESNVGGSLDEVLMNLAMIEGEVRMSRN